MTTYIALWAAFIIATGAIAWFGTKRQAVAFAVVAFFTATIPAMTLGHPSLRLPPKNSVVLGFKIDEPRAIYVLIDVDGTEPRYYRLPYSDKAAKDLQDAQYATEDAGEGQIVMDGADGAVGFSERLPEPPAPKTADTPLIDGGFDVE